MMNRAYLIWIGALVLGGLAGIFLKPRTVGTFLAYVLGICLLGFVTGGITGSETAVWVFGIALMLLPILGGIFFAGAVLYNAAVRAARRRSRDPEDSG